MTPLTSRFAARLPGWSASRPAGGATARVPPGHGRPSATFPTGIPRPLCSRNPASPPRTVNSPALPVRIPVLARKLCSRARRVVLLTPDWRLDSSLPSLSPRKTRSVENSTVVFAFDCGKRLELVRIVTVQHVLPRSEGHTLRSKHGARRSAEHIMRRQPVFRRSSCTTMHICIAARRASGPTFPI